MKLHSSIASLHSRKMPLPHNLIQRSGKLLPGGSAREGDEDEEVSLEGVLEDALAIGRSPDRYSCKTQHGLSPRMLPIGLKSHADDHMACSIITAACEHSWALRTFNLTF